MKTEYFLILDVLDKHKGTKMNFEECVDSVLRLNDSDISKEDLLKKSKKRYFEILEEDQYIHSLS